MRVALAFTLLDLITASCGHIPTLATTKLDAVVSVIPDSFRLGDSVRVNVTITNHGPVATQVSTPCPGPFVVTTSDGTRLGPDPATPCTLIAVVHELAAGQELVLSEVWGRRSLIGTPAPNWSFLTPGDLLVSAHIPVAGSNVYAPPVQIHVSQ
jgi:hypothetical protein